MEFFDVDRGGDVTFHGPGQLVGYPIVDLRQHKEDLHWYLRQLEVSLIRALATFDITGEQSKGLTGVWTSGSQDRVDRRACEAVGDLARLCAQRDHRPLVFRSARAVQELPAWTMTSIEQELLRREHSTCLAPSPALGEEARDAACRRLGGNIRMGAARIFVLCPERTTCRGRAAMSRRLKVSEPEARHKPEARCHKPRASSARIAALRRRVSQRSYRAPARPLPRHATTAARFPPLRCGALVRHARQRRQRASTILLATTRRAVQRDRAGDRYGPYDADSLQFAAVSVNVPPVQRARNRRSTPPEHALSSTFSSAPNQARDFFVSSVIPADSNRFVQRIAADLANTRSRNILVFVHGFNTSFEDVAAILRRANRRRSQLRDGTVVLFSWAFGRIRSRATSAINRRCAQRGIPSAAPAPRSTLVAAAAGSA